MDDDAIYPVALGLALPLSLYRVVQLNFTPEIEVFDMQFDRSHSIFSMTSLKQQINNASISGVKSSWTSL